MVTAFVDMVGMLMVIPLLPFYAERMGGGGLWVGVLVSAFSMAQLLSAPWWGRVSDRYGRRPALLVGLGSSAAAFVIFAFADSLWLLLLSRLVQGAGGGTVGVVQAYVADTTAPKDRAKSLGWLSAATNAGVAIGPVLGGASLAWGRPAPGLLAAGLCLVNMAFAWTFLHESLVATPAGQTRAVPRRSREIVREVLSRPGEAAPRLIWIYAIGMGAFAGFNAVLALFLAKHFGFTERTIGWVFMWNGIISVIARAGLLGRLVDWLGEAKLARVGQSLLGLALFLMPFTWRLDGAPIVVGSLSIPPRFLVLAGVITLVPLGTAFTFPCVTALLSHVIDPNERGAVMGVQQSYGGVARVIAPLASGWAWDALGTGYPFWGSAVLVLGTLFLTFGIDRGRAPGLRTPPLRPAPPPAPTPSPAAD